MNTDRDRLLQENEEQARLIKEELIELREAMLRSENALNALAIERTNLEADSEDERIEIPPELQAFVPANPTPKPRRIWPKVIAGCVVLVALLLGLGGLGIFNNDGGASVTSRTVRATPDVSAPAAKKEDEAAIDRSSSIPIPRNTNSTSDKKNDVPDEVPMNILPGTTYTSEISYSMKSSVITLVEVHDTPQITMRLNHAPQSFFIPMKTSFRVDSEGIGTEQRNGSLTVLPDSKKHDLEIRFEPHRLPPERRILGVSLSQ